MSEEPITLTKSDLQALLESAADAAIEKYHRTAATKPPTQTEAAIPPTRRRGRGGHRGDGPHGIRAFDPNTKATGSLSEAEWLWNPGKTHTCPCGEVSYADTQEFIGTFSIETAMAGTVIKASDGVTVVATRPGWMPMEQLPPELAYTEEKAEHMRQCQAANPDVDPGMLRSMYDDKLKEAE